MNWSQWRPIFPFLSTVSLQYQFYKLTENKFRTRSAFTFLLNVTAKSSWRFWTDVAIRNQTLVWFRKFCTKLHKKVCNNMLYCSYSGSKHFTIYNTNQCFTTQFISAVNFPLYQIIQIQNERIIALFKQNVNLNKHPQQISSKRTVPSDLCEGISGSFSINDLTSCLEMV